MKRILAICFVILSSTIAFAGPPDGIYPKDLEGLELTWQSRASMYLEEQCVGNKCDLIANVSEEGRVYVLGAAYFYGNDAIYLDFTEACMIGETTPGLCGSPYPVYDRRYRVLLRWDEDAGAYLRVIETEPGLADFDALTMDTTESGRLQIGTFEIKGNGKVYHYDRDVIRDVWRFNRWWPPMGPDPGPV